MNYAESFKRDQKKALEAVTKNYDLKSYDLDTEYTMQAWKSMVDSNIDLISLKNLFFSEIWIYILVNCVARKISKQFLSIYREVVQNGSIVKVPSENNSLLSLFNNPNEYEAYSSFMYKLATELTLMGNAIIWRLKFHKEMMILPTEIVTIETDNKGKILYYLVNFGVVNEFSSVYRGQIKIFPEDVIHIKLPNPNSMYWGLSPFIPARKAALFDKYSREYLINFYISQANPGAVLEMGEAANETQALRFLKSVELNWVGRKNQRRTMILPKGVTAKNLSQTLAEQSLKDHIEQNLDSLRSVLAVPPHELGLQSSGSLGSNETKESIKNFWEQTILPFQGIITDTFSQFFRKELGAKRFFEFDNTNVAILQEDQNTKADLAGKLKGIWTVNEIRERLYQMKPLEGGDSLQNPQNQNPFSQQFQYVTSDPKANNSSPLQEEEKPINFESKTANFLKMNNSWWERRKSKGDNDIAKVENKVFQTMLNIFADQAPIVLEMFRDKFSEILKTKGLKEDLLNDMKTDLNEEFKGFESVYAKNAVPSLKDSSVVGYDIHIDTPYELPKQDEIARLREDNQKIRDAQLQARILKNFVGINETTTNEVIAKIESGMNEGKNIDQITNSIKDYFKNVIPNRARTISRTESLLAVSLGQKAAEEDASEVIPGMKKMWITAGDNRVRDSHEDLDGKKVDVNEDFKSNLAYPRDPRGAANETINCRCTWLMIPPEQIDLFP